MTLPNPEHLFEQAERLSTPVSPGALRQTDLRRAISNAYYGLFHFVLTALADEFVGSRLRSQPRYVLVYRSVNHGTLRTVCTELQKPRPAPRFGQHATGGAFDAGILQLANTIVDLQGRRHDADYNPAARFDIPDARIAVRAARSAIAAYATAAADHRRSFLTLLLCPPR